MTDKTSTAPVMSLQQVRDYLRSPKMVGVLDQTEMLADAIDAHLSTTTPDVVGGDVVAWVTPEGDRSITASQKTQGERDGGGSASSVRPFSVPAYAAPRVQGDAEQSVEAVVINTDGQIPPGFILQVVSARRIPDGTKLYASLAAQPKGDELVRYCPECSLMGDVPVGALDCCPDGSAARMIPRHIAHAAHRDFHHSIQSHPAEQTRGDGVASTVNGTPVSAEVWALAKSKHPHNGDMKVGYAHGYAEAIAAPRQAVPDAVAKRNQATGEAIERAAESLPNGYTIEIAVEKDAGTIWLFDLAGEEVDYSYDDETMASRINGAIETAIAAAPSAGRMGVG